LRTYREYHTVENSNRKTIYEKKKIEFNKFLRKSIDKIIQVKCTSMVDFPREVDNITRKPSSVDRSGLVCIGKIPVRMLGKCCQCTPVETQVSRMRSYLFI